MGSILGALGFGIVSDLFSRQTGVLVILVFFVAGAALLSRVDVDRGIREAQQA
jgi:UMF1 family MFS transporter